MVRDYQQAEDLTHETFLKAYLHMDSFEKKSSVKTWLFSIARNITIDFLRKNKRITVLNNQQFTEADKRPLPEEMVVFKENSLELYNALGKLKESHREILILRKIKGMSIEETARILNCSETKVKSLLFRALPALEKILKKEGYIYEERVQRNPS